MSDPNDLFEDDYDLDDSSASFDLEKMKNNIPTFTSEKLCEIIVAHRYLGFNEQAAVLCMQELASRRSSGDTFQFEQYIEECQKDMPEIQFSIPDFRSVIGQLTTTLKVK
jgi:hypothetical protein